MFCRTDKTLRCRAMFLIYKARRFSHGSPSRNPYLLCFNIHTVLLHWHSHNIHRTLVTKSEYPRNPWESGNGLRRPVRVTCGSSANRNIHIAPVCVVEMESFTLWSMVHTRALRSMVATITWIEEMYRKITSGTVTRTNAWFQASAAK